VFTECSLAEILSKAKTDITARTIRIAVHTLI